MIRRRAALVAAWSIVLAGLTLVGPATPLVHAHSQLVTSIPAAGEVVPTAPASIRLVFSEAIESAYSKIDVLDPLGKTLAAGIGAPDPSDPYSLVAPLPPLAAGIYTVEWRALSAADGHKTSGFFTFGVGDVTPPPVGSTDGGSGSIHAGHDATTAFLETESRIVGDLGLLLAFGLPVIGWLVLRDRRSVGLVRWTGAGLGLAVVGVVGLIVLGAIDIGSDPVSYATSGRNGQLLLTQAAICAVGAVIVLALASRRTPQASAVGAAVALAGFVLLAISGHAAAYDSPAPAAAIVAHLVAASIWLSGILVLAWKAIAGDGEPLSALVPRFSALALVSVGLVALTGVYSDWVQTRTLLSLDTPYSATLLVKVALGTAAFTLGAFNYVSGGRASDRRFRPRVVVESGLALAVVLATGVLASGSPPAQEKPVAIAVVPSSVVAGVTPPTLELAPGRPGPTRFVVTMAPAVSTVELVLQRLDSNGSSRLELRAGSTPGTFEAGGGLLPAGSRWDASVVVHAQDGTEVSRTRYAFALDAESVSEGRATPAIDPAIIVAVILLVGAALGFAFTLGGGSLPRVDPATSRIAVLGGSAASVGLGALILFGGPKL